MKSEDEFINKRRNGKGKENYWNGKLVFEGEYLNGKRYGKRKEYKNKGKIRFKGEFLNGKKLNGKRYDEEGNRVRDGIREEYDSFL